MTLSPQTLKVIRCAIELLPTLRAASEEISALFTEGNITRAMSGLTELADGLQELQKGLELIFAAGGSELSDLNVCLIRLEAVYPLLLRAIEDEDPVALSDILNYELVPALEDCNIHLRSRYYDHNGSYN